jgi:hypothetical protein
VQEERLLVHKQPSNVGGAATKVDGAAIKVKAIATNVIGREKRN